MIQQKERNPKSTNQSSRLHRFLLIGIVVFAFVLRVYKADSIPPALTWDEVSIGYNAWSILKTGRDEHGKWFPIDTFTAYGDYKPPVAIYLTVPFVAVFGLSEFGVRLPVILFGTLTVLMTYILVKSITEQKISEFIALSASLLLAVSPWHINLSRAGFEAIIAHFFIVLGIWMLVKDRVSVWFIRMQWIPFVLAFYTFNSARYSIPLLIPAIIMYKLWNKHSIQAKVYVQSIVIACVCLLPIVPHVLSPEARLRFKEVNIFSDIAIVELSNQRIEAAGNTLWAKFIFNRRIGYTLAYLKHYLDHFEPSFLFIKGDGNPKFSIQDVGQLYAVEAVFLIVGWYAVFALNKKAGFLLLSWLLLTIVPAGVARETPHALRIANTLPVWQIIIAYGIYTFWQLLNKRKRIFFGLFVSCIYLFSFLYYLHNYYNHYPYEFSGEWQYGYKQAIRKAEAIKDQYDSIVLSGIIGRPYMYTLFYGAYAPDEFIQTKQSFFDAAGFYQVKRFGKYIFTETGIPDVQGKVLYILPPEQMPEGKRIIDRIHLLNGVEVLRLFD